MHPLHRLFLGEVGGVEERLVNILWLWVVADYGRMAPSRPSRRTWPPPWEVVEMGGNALKMITKMFNCAQ
jgi:hypothetical protein